MLVLNQLAAKSESHELAELLVRMDGSSYSL